MNKIYLLFFSLLVSVVGANEPTMGILKSVDSNTHQRLNIAKYTYVCEAYGVISLQKLLQEPKLSSQCRESIGRFFIQNPNLKYFSAMRLHLMQTYRFEFKKSGCVLFASGKRTLSELLLREGLALIRPGFKDREYDSLFEYAQKNARIEGKGVWREESLKSCLGEIYN